VADLDRLSGAALVMDLDVAGLKTGTHEVTPTANLPVGTYTYFCRIHPYMRGAFRVK